MLLKCLFKKNSVDFCNVLYAVREISLLDFEFY